VLQQLHDEQFKLYIYSSGSVEAQKLLLSHTTDGDISQVRQTLHCYGAGQHNAKRDLRTLHIVKTQISPYTTYNKCKCKHI